MNLRLENKDCMQVMAEYPDNYFDLAIVDPPYGLEICNKSYLGKTTNDKRWNNRANGYRHTVKEWDNKTPDLMYFNELKRISKNQIIWGWNYYVSILNNCPSYIVWNKEASGNYSDCEIAWCSINTTNKVFKWLWNGFRKQKPEERIHPTQKPIALYEWILLTYSNKDFKIIDTHLGSGSSLIAADKFGVAEFVGCEIDKEYYENLIKRYNQFKAQTVLSFDCA